MAEQAVPGNPAMEFVGLPRLQFTARSGENNLKAGAIFASAEGQSLVSRDARLNPGIPARVDEDRRGPVAATIAQAFESYLPWESLVAGRTLAQKLQGIRGFRHVPECSQKFHERVGLLF